MTSEFKRSHAFSEVWNFDIVLRLLTYSICICSSSVITSIIWHSQILGWLSTFHLIFTIYWLVQFFELIFNLQLIKSLWTLVHILDHTLRFELCCAKCHSRTNCFKIFLAFSEWAFTLVRLRLRNCSFSSFHFAWCALFSLRKWWFRFNDYILFLSWVWILLVCQPKKMVIWILLLDVEEKAGERPH